MKLSLLILVVAPWLGLQAQVETTVTTPPVEVEAVEPADRRLADLKDLNGYFPFAVPRTKSDWEKRAAQLRKRVLVANGLWPMPPKNWALFRACCSITAQIAQYIGLSDRWFPCAVTFLVGCLQKSSNMV